MRPVSRRDDGWWSQNFEPDEGRSGPVHVALYAQPLPGRSPDQKIGAARLSAWLAEKIDDGQVQFVRLTRSGGKGVTAQVVRAGSVRRAWHLGIPDPEDRWDVMLSTSEWIAFGIDHQGRLRDR